MKTNALHKHVARAVLATSVAFLVATFLACSASAPETQTAASAKLAPTPEPMLYAFQDHGETRPRFPADAAIGPMGGMISLLWEPLNPGPGEYDWRLIDERLEAEANYTVTLRSGEIAPRPVVLQVFPYVSSNPGWTWSDFYDATPDWVYRQINTEVEERRPIVGGRYAGYWLVEGDRVAVLPMYDNTTWQQSYFDFVTALGERYDGHPQIASVVVNTGLDGETQMCKAWQGIDWPALAQERLGYGIVWAFSQFPMAAMDAYRGAFPTTPLFINNAPGGSTMRSTTTEHAASLEPPVGLKHSGMWTDIDIHEGTGNFVGSWDMVRAYSDTLPIWIESAYGFGSAEHDYWALMAGLHYHPDAMDLHAEFQQQCEPSFLGWVSDHLGRTPAAAPSVWIALRDREYDPVSWGSGGASGHNGDWNYWLYRVEPTGGHTVRVWQDELPQACRDQVYSRQARRTNQATADTAIYLDIDDAYPGAGSLPLDHPAGWTRWHVRLILLNQGQDRLVVRYENAQDGQTSQIITKGAELGEPDRFVEIEMTLDDAWLNNGLEGGADLAIDCLGDGDEVVHLVELWAEENALSHWLPLLTK